MVSRTVDRRRPGADDVPHVLALGRVEAGGRLVEEDHRRGGRRGWPRGRAADACRRSRSSPAGRRRRRGRTTRAARRRGPARAARGEVQQRADEQKVLGAGEVLVDRGVLPGEADRLRRTWCGSVTTSYPPTRAVPAWAWSRVARMRTAVVLPAPLGPSTPRTVPGGTARSTPSRACGLAEALPSPSASIARPIVSPSSRWTPSVQRRGGPTFRWFAGGEQLGISSRSAHRLRHRSTYPSVNGYSTHAARIRCRGRPRPRRGRTRRAVPR